MKRALRSLLVPILVVFSSCGVPPVASLECGSVRCAVEPGAYCAVCPAVGGSTFACGIMPPLDQRPDWWQPSVVCPGGRGDVPFFECDGHEDCAADAYCTAVVSPSTIPFAMCRKRAELADWCGRPSFAIVCRDADDCPSCATGCEPIEADMTPTNDFPLKHCRQ